MFTLPTAAAVVEGAMSGGVSPRGAQSVLSCRQINHNNNGCALFQVSRTLKLVTFLNEAVEEIHRHRRAPQGL